MKAPVLLIALLTLVNLSNAQLPGQYGDNSGFATSMGMLSNDGEPGYKMELGFGIKRLFEFSLSYSNFKLPKEYWYKDEKGFVVERGIEANYWIIREEVFPQMKIYAGCGAGISFGHFNGVVNNEHYYSVKLFDYKDLHGIVLFMADYRPLEHWLVQPAFALGNNFRINPGYTDDDSISLRLEYSLSTGYQFNDGFTLGVKVGKKKIDKMSEPFYSAFYFAFPINAPADKQ